MNELKLREFVNRDQSVSEYVLTWEHGFLHSKYVEAFGLLMVEEYAKENIIVDKDVVQWFAYLHDIMNNGINNDNHGEKAANYIDEVRNIYLQDLSESQIEKLKKACALHSTTIATGDITIDVCFDADRLDSPKFDRVTDPEKMATRIGKDLAHARIDALRLYVKPFVRDLFQFSDDYVIRNPYVGHFAFRFVAGANSLFTSGNWERGKKSVSIDTFYKHSAIYGVPISKYDTKTSFYGFAMHNFDVILLEYEEEDVIRYQNNDNYLEDTSKFPSPIKEIFEPLLKFANEHFSLEEVLLRRCNIVYEAHHSEFWDNWKERLEDFADWKLSIYNMNKYEEVNEIAGNLVKGLSNCIMKNKSFL